MGSFPVVQRLQGKDEPINSISAPYVMLVEDNQDDVDLTLMVLRESRLANEVVVAKDGAEALELLLGSGQHEDHGLHLPQLILLDINLPKMSGIDVLKALRADQRTRLVPVVMLTNSREDQDVLESYAGGANSYVQKPVEFEEFSQALRNLGVYWLVLNHSAAEHRLD